MTLITPPTISQIVSRIGAEATLPFPAGPRGRGWEPGPLVVVVVGGRGQGAGQAGEAGLSGQEEHGDLEAVAAADPRGEGVGLRGLGKVHARLLARRVQSAHTHTHVMSES